MDIIFVHQGIAYAMQKTKGFCCGPGWRSGGNRDCQIKVRVLCDTELCSGRSKTLLEKCLGHPVGWRLLGKVPIEGKHMYVVDLDESFEVAQREKSSDACHLQCSAYKESICSKYCSGKGYGALCAVLGEAIGVNSAVFRRIK